MGVVQSSEDGQKGVVILLLYPLEKSVHYFIFSLPTILLYVHLNFVLTGIQDRQAQVRGPSSSRSPSPRRGTRIVQGRNEAQSGSGCFGRVTEGF